MMGPQGSVFNTGVNGMLRSYSQIARDANTIAQAGTTVAESKDTLGDITTAMVDMKVQEHLFSANAKVIKTADDMLGTLLDIKS